MSLDSDTLQLFVRIATIGAFGEAGREFGLSPTAVTHRIKGLESELGVALFNRTTRTVALTANGELFLKHTFKILENIEDARSEIAGGKDNIRGQLRIAGSASFGRRYIAPHIAEFLDEYPHVRVKLDLSDKVIDIVEQGFDLALRIGTLSSSSLIASKITDNPRVLIASPAYIKKYGKPKIPQDLTSHNCLVLGDTRNWRLRDLHGDIHNVRVSGNFSTNYGEVIAETAIADVGIALKSKWDIEHQLTDGSLVPVLEDYAVDPLWSLWAVRPPAQIAPARVSVFTEFIKKKFKKNSKSCVQNALTRN